MLGVPPLPSADILIHDDMIANPPHLYCKQPYSLQIIQLVEGPPPPPRRLSSVVDSTSAGPSSYSDSTDYSSHDDDDDDYDEDDNEEEDDEEICSSYCSSDLPPEEFESTSVRPESLSPPPPSPPPDTYDLRMKRILAWRENFSAAMTATLSDGPLSTCLKRKLDHSEGEDDYDETVSHSSKRSRTEDDDWSVSSLGEHSCPACDATFSTRQSLRRHGLDAAKSNEACSSAVEYAFE
ncbi:hypothetical protein AX17_006823 [Amanita inopinata Kibby_2008]|nr:hypothetical protein AX17_006823 [Amanita inopinata Kibby_2008]